MCVCIRVYTQYRLLMQYQSPLPEEDRKKLASGTLTVYCKPQTQLVRSEPWQELVLLLDVPSVSPNLTQSSELTSEMPWYGKALLSCLSFLSSICLVLMNDDGPRSSARDERASWALQRLCDGYSRSLGFRGGELRPEHPSPPSGVTSEAWRLANKKVQVSFSLQQGQLWRAFTTLQSIPTICAYS